MYIVAIAWIYITLLMALTEANVTAGVLTFVFYGLLPCALFIWIVGTPQRRRNKKLNDASIQQELDQPDRSNTEHNQ
jgi:hypothetical protein